MALSGMKYVNLNNEIVKIFGVHFSYYKNFEQDKNFCEHIVKLCQIILKNILKLWRMRQLTLRKNDGLQILIAVSKVIHLLLITKLHNNTLIVCIKYRKTLFGKGKRQKINAVLFAMTIKEGGIENVDLRNKITSM